MKGFFAEKGDWVNDGLLWHAFTQGSRSAFDLIYQSNIQHLIGYGYKVTANRGLIQDCIQDLFVELWESRERLSNVASIKYYLLKSLRYKIVRHLQADRQEPFSESRHEAIDDSYEGVSHDEETATRQSIQLKQAIEKLPKRQQEAIHLRYFQGLSNEEVARVMDINYQSACKFIYTGLKTLRDIMHLSSVIPFLFPFL